MRWWKVIIGVMGAIGVIGMGWYVTRPVPGTRMDDQGREHVSPQAVSEFNYNSNPPTSGQHDPDWVRPGVYTEPQNKGKLIHSLEHGYIVVHYSCTTNPKSQIPMTNTVATGSAVVDTQACNTLIKQLEDVVREKKLKKLILVPQPDLDKTIALSAWTYLDTFDTFDAGRIGRFIDYHRDQGPEKTME